MLTTVAVNVLFCQKINLCHKLTNKIFCDVNWHSNHLLSAEFYVYIVTETLKKSEFVAKSAWQNDGG